jgi:hypothetical protein
MRTDRIVEVPVEAQDVRMPQMALDFYLSSQLVLHLRLLKLVLEEHLQGHNVLALQTGPRCISPHK